MAYEAMKAILKDPRSPAGARAIVSRTLFEAGGLLKAPDETGEKEPHELTADELQAKIARLRAQAAERAQPVIDVEPRRIGQPKSDNGVFD